MGAAAAPLAIGGASIAGSLINAGASKSAASAASGADLRALLLQQQMFQQQQANAQPFIAAGRAALPDFQQFYKVSADQLGGAYDEAHAHIPGPMDQATLEATPGYQFTLGQGLRAVQNSAASKGLGVSGNALQGAANYATGLANQTYKDQFGINQQIYQDYLNQLAAKQGQLGTVYQQMQNVASLGANAAANQGNLAVQSAANQGNALVNSGLAQASGATGVGNAISGGLQGLGNAGLLYLGLQNGLNNTAATAPQSGAVGGAFGLD